MPRPESHATGHLPRYSLSVTARIDATSAINISSFTSSLSNHVTADDGVRDLGHLYPGANLPRYHSYYRGSGGSLVAILQSPDPRQVEVTSYSSSAQDCYRDLVAVLRPLLRHHAIGVELQDIGSVHPFPRKVPFSAQLRSLLFNEHLLIFLIVPGVVAFAAIAWVAETGNPRSVTLIAGVVLLVADIFYIILFSLFRAMRSGELEVGI
jgi:hypothetical protein